jgi:hypothetical protein
MRPFLAGAALTAFVVTPTLADYYIVQEPTTKRCNTNLIDGVLPWVVLLLGLSLPSLAVLLLG